MHIDIHNLQIDWFDCFFSECRIFIQYDFSLIQDDRLVLAYKEL
jgi:hypothetical protein